MNGERRALAARVGASSVVGGVGVAGVPRSTCSLAGSEINASGPTSSPATSTGSSLVASGRLTGAAAGARAGRRGCL